MPPRRNKQTSGNKLGKHDSALVSSKSANVTNNIALPEGIRFFPRKLWLIVNDNHYRDAIRWSDNGATIIVNEPALRSVCLGKENQIFKTYKLRSFVRQLHLYGFRKIAKNEYKNDNFLKGNPELLLNLKRDAHTTKHRAIRSLDQKQPCDMDEVSWENLLADPNCNSNCLLADTRSELGESSVMDQPAPAEEPASIFIEPTMYTLTPVKPQRVEIFDEARHELMNYELCHVELCEQYYANVKLSNNYILTTRNDEITQTFAYS